MSHDSHIQESIAESLQGQWDSVTWLSHSRKVEDSLKGPCHMIVYSKNQALIYQSETFKIFDILFSSVYNSERRDIDNDNHSEIL